VPKPFLTAREKFGERIVQYGCEVSKKYQDWLKQGVIVVSTAIQENFGISIVEAVRYGCYPLLPNNLSYPELIPIEHHDDCLYRSQEKLEEKLSFLLRKPEKFAEKREDLASHMERYSWELVIDKYDEKIEQLAAVSTVEIEMQLASLGSLWFQGPPKLPSPP